jgi:general secretion pathway protein J
MTIMQKGQGNAGFTLIEMLLVIGLLALITSTILGGLRLGKRAWETGRSYDAHDELDNTARAISGLLKRSFPAEVVDESYRSVIAFSGRPDRCYFTTLSDGKTQIAGLLSTEIGFRSESGRRDLAVWTKIYRAEPGSFMSRKEMLETNILQNVESLKFSYFGAHEQDQAPAWQDNWLSSDHLPELISVRLGAKRSGNIIEIYIVVSLPNE